MLICDELCVIFISRVDR